MNYLSLFSGIGGFELGIQNSKYGDKLKCIGYSEVDKYADSIYSRQFPSRVEDGIELHKPLGDARHIETSTLPNFELLVGGFPCQAFSNAGHRRGFDDTRGTLFFEIARILRDKRPRYFLLENVKGLLYHNKGETFKTILGVLAELGYNVQWEILNSKNFGVPQNRERIYIKGYFRASSGCEVLSKPRSSGEIGKVMNAYTSPSRNCKVIDTNGISGALTTGGKDSGFNSLILDKVNDTATLGCDGVNSLVEDTNPRVIGNTNPSGKGIGGNVYDSNRLYPTLTVNKGDALKIGVDKDNPKIDIVVDNDYLSNRVVGIDGISMALTATNYKHPYKVAIEKEETDNEPQIKVVGNTNPSGQGMYGKVYDTNGLSPSLNTRCENKICDVEDLESIDFDRFFTDITDDVGITTTKDGDAYALNTKYRGRPLDKYLDNFVRIKNGTKKGYLEAEQGEDGILVGRVHSDNRRGRVQPKSTGSLDTQPSWGVYQNYHIRRLTPLECERLQAFPDNWTKYGKEGEEISNTQRYKCLGNAVTISVITFIMNNWDLKLD